MVYQKPFFKIPPSRRTILDLNFKAILIHYSSVTDSYFPMGLRSKQRFKKLLRPSESIEARLSLSRKHHLALSFIEQQVRSVPAELFPTLVALAKMRGFSLYFQGKNICENHALNSRKNVDFFDRE